MLQWIQRVNLLPAGVRAGIAVAMALAMSVAWPPELVFGKAGLLIYLVALYPAVAPRGAGPTVAIVVAGIGWIVATTRYEERIVLWRVIILAVLAYLVHTLAALAAFVPLDAIVHVGVLTTWLLRVAEVLLISATATVITLGLATDVSGNAFLVATAIGLAAAAAATLLLARLVRRP